MGKSVGLWRNASTSFSSPEDTAELVLREEHKVTQDLPGYLSGLTKNDSTTLPTLSSSDDGRPLTCKTNGGSILSKDVADAWMQMGTNSSSLDLSGTGSSTTLTDSPIVPVETSTKSHYGGLRSRRSRSPGRANDRSARVLPNHDRTHREKARSFHNDGRKAKDAQAQPVLDKNRQSCDEVSATTRQAQPVLDKNRQSCDEVSATTRSSSARRTRLATAFSSLRRFRDNPSEKSKQSLSIVPSKSNKVSLSRAQLKSSLMNGSDSSSLWRTAVDEKSGRTYYYHTVTRETQWRKPVELASDQERQEMAEKERRQREFFSAMEANILNSISNGDYAAEITTPTTTEPVITMESAPPSIPRPMDGLVRTISELDETVIRNLAQRVPSHRNVFGQQQEPSQREIKFSPTDWTGGNSSWNSSWNSSSSSIQGSRATTSSRLLAIQEVMETTDAVTPDMAMMRMRLDETEKVVARESSRRGRLASTHSGTLSLNQLLTNLPESKEEECSRNSFYGNLSLDDSTLSLGLNPEEVKALQNLAAVTDEMSSVGGQALHGLDVLNEEDDDDQDCSSQTSRETASPALSSSSREENERGTADSSLRMRIEPQLSHPSARSRSKRVATPSSVMEKPGMVRRNTCSTLYVGSTMSAPDIEAQIKCICGVIRAHILQSERLDAPMPEKNDEYRIFNDLQKHQKPLDKRASRFRPNVDFVVRPPAPTLEEITAFYRDVYGRAQMESDCLIMSLIYIERLIKVTHGALRPRSTNWRSILFSCLVLSSKVWDDLSMWNADFSQTCPSGVKFSLKRINELEIEVLSTLKYKTKVDASEYAKYYFLIRTMLIKSGLGGEELTNPLDVEGAKRLQQMSALYQAKHAAMNPLEVGLGRSKSVGHVDRSQLQSPSNAVSLEHVVQM